MHLHKLKTSFMMEESLNSIVMVTLLQFSLNRFTGKSKVEEINDEQTVNYFRFTLNKYLTLDTSQKQYRQRIQILYTMEKYQDVSERIYNPINLSICLITRIVNFVFHKPKDKFTFTISATMGNNFRATKTNSGKLKVNRGILFI